MLIIGNNGSRAITEWIDKQIFKNFKVSLLRNDGTGDLVDLENYEKPLLQLPSPAM